MKKTNIIPIVFTTDDNYIPFLCVSINSICKNNKSNHFLNFYIFHDGLSDDNIKALNSFNSEFSQILLVNVQDKINKIIDKLCVRDNYSKAIYYRFFIPEILADFDKAIYLDCDVVVLDDIFNLYKTVLGKNLVGATIDEAVYNSTLFIDYTSKYLNIPLNKYFNSGVLLFNCKEFRSQQVFNKFLSLIDTVKFKVAPDQDYLNVLCQNKVKYIQKGWNKMPIIDPSFKNKNLKLVHYNLNYKPWRFDGIKYANFFWEYVKNTPFQDKIYSEKDIYTKEQKKKDDSSLKNLLSICQKCVDKNCNYLGE